MARKRMIDPGIWQNEQVGTLPLEGRLLFIGMFSNADDEGRLKASAAYLKAIIFPYDENLSLKRVEELKQQVAAHGLVALYRIGGQEYLWLPTWDRHQKIKTPSASQLPPPPAGDSSPKPDDASDGAPPRDLPGAGEAVPKDAPNNGETVRQCSASVAEGLPRHSSNGGETFPKDLRNDGEALQKRFGNDGGGLPLDCRSGGEAVPLRFPPAVTLAEPCHKGEEGLGLNSPGTGGADLDRAPSAGETFPKDFRNAGETFPPRLEEVRGSKEKLEEVKSVEGKGSGETVPGPVPPADGLQPPATLWQPDPQPTLTDASPGERQCLKLLRGLAHWPFDFQRDLAYLRQLSVEFPTVDMPREVSDFATHVMDKPINKNRGSPRLRLRHWIEKGAQFAAERRRQGEPRRETGPGLSGAGRPPQKAARTPIRPIESGPDEGIASAGRQIVEPIEPEDTS